MKNWGSWYCPKCGSEGKPVWKGVIFYTVGEGYKNIDGPLLAECWDCGYTEEVVPLDKQDKKACGF